MNLQQFKGGFPSVPIIKADRLNKPKTGKKKSLFAQQFNKLDKKKDLGQENAPDPPTVNQDFDQNIPEPEEQHSNSSNQASSSNTATSGDSVKAGIDEENRAKLNSMSKQEILEEQEKLLNTLGMTNNLYDYSNKNKNIRNAVESHHF